MTKYGWHANKLTAYDVTIDNDLTITGDLSFGDASTDTLTVTGSATFSTDVTMTFASDSEDLVITKTDTSGTAGTGGYGIKYTADFTEVAASAHKGGFFQVAYNPDEAAGTACSIGVEGQVTVEGDVTETNNYPGYGYGLQGRIHIKNGITINSGDLDPGSTYAGVRAVATDAGTGTFTKGTITCLMVESQVSQDVSSANFNMYLGWFRAQGSTTTTDIDAAIYIDAGDAWDPCIDSGIKMSNCIKSAVFEFADDGSICHDTDTGSATNLQFNDFKGYVTVKVGSATRYIPLLENKPSGLS